MFTACLLWRHHLHTHLLTGYHEVSCQGQKFVVNLCSPLYLLWLDVCAGWFLWQESQSQDCEMLHPESPHLRIKEHCFLTPAHALFKGQRTQNKGHISEAAKENSVKGLGSTHCTLQQALTWAPASVSACTTNVNLLSKFLGPWVGSTLCLCCTANLFLWEQQSIQAKKASWVLHCIAAHGNLDWAPILLLHLSVWTECWCETSLCQSLDTVRWQTCDALKVLRFLLKTIPWHPVFSQESPLGGYQHGTKTTQSTLTEAVVMILPYVTQSH